MTDSTDALVGAVGGLIVLGVAANMANKMINSKPVKVVKKAKPLNKKSAYKSIW